MSDTHLGIMMVFGHDKHLFSAPLKICLEKNWLYTTLCSWIFWDNFEIIKFLENKKTEKTEKNWKCNQKLSILNAEI